MVDNSKKKCQKRMNKKKCKQSLTEESMIYDICDLNIML